MSSEPIPEDVIITILELFDVDDDDDRRTIQTCAFLSRSLLPHCRRLLFSTFKVGEKPFFSHCRSARVDSNVALHRFHNLLSSNQNLIPFVRNVVITHVLNIWILDNIQLPNLLRMLTHVICLQVFVTVGTQHWASLPDPLTSSLSGLISKPHFEALKLRGLSGIPIQRFMTSAGLRNLSIHHIRGVFSINHEDTGSEGEGDGDDGSIKLLKARFWKDIPCHSTTPLPSGLSFIESLSFGGTSKFFIKHFQLFNRFSHLRWLSVDPKSSLDVEVAWLIIRYAAETLLSLEWSFSYEEMDDMIEPISTGPITLPAMRKLTTLSFTVAFLWCGDSSHPLTAWNNFLESASPSQPMRFLRTILVTFDCLMAERDDFEHNDYVTNLFSDATQPTWDRFTNLVGSANRFPALEELKISILVAPRLSYETESSVGSGWGECKCPVCMDVEVAASVNVHEEYDYSDARPWTHFDDIPQQVKERMSWLRRAGLHFCIEVMSD